jgi:hypothetical protein
VSERDAAEALERELDRLRPERRLAKSLTVSELVEAYLAQHDVEPVMIEKLRWLLGKAVAAFGERPVREIRPEEVAAWRIALSPGYRFDGSSGLRPIEQARAAATTPSSSSRLGRRATRASSRDVWQKATFRLMDYAPIE